MTEIKKRGRKKELTWNVYVSNPSGWRIEPYNIFKHRSFAADLKKAAKDFKDDREGFEEQANRELRYYFWAKCEWEILLDHWPPHDNYPSVKIDVYDQVMLNKEQFLDYLWENRNNL